MKQLTSYKNAKDELTKAFILKYFSEDDELYDDYHWIGGTLEIAAEYWFSIREIEEIFENDFTEDDVHEWHEYKKLKTEYWSPKKWKYNII